MTDHTHLTSDEILFTNAFNAHRGCLAAFAKCGNRDELHIVRDGFLLALAAELCPSEYEPVRNRIVLDPAVAAVATSSKSGNGDSNSDGDGNGIANGDDVFSCTVLSARKSPGWECLIKAVKCKAVEVNSDLDKIWMTLEEGRIEWLTAASMAHPIKMKLQAALDKQCGGAAEGDVSDAKMIWMYALSLNIPRLAKEREAWKRATMMVDPERPFMGYKAELWDARKDEWRKLDLGVQAAAERGGASLDAAWKSI